MQEAAPFAAAGCVHPNLFRRHHGAQFAIRWAMTGKSPGQAGSRAGAGQELGGSWAGAGRLQLAALCARRCSIPGEMDSRNGSR